MIKNFIFKQFKSFKEATLEVENLTTIIGSNASGKTNAIEGIKILSEIVSGRDLSVILDGSKNVDSDIRGGSIGCPRIGTDSFTLGCTLDLDREYDLEYSITIKVRDRILVLSESLLKSTQGHVSEIVFQSKETTDDRSDIYVEYNNGKKGRNPQLLCTRSVSLLTQLSSKMPSKTEKYRENLRYINLVKEQLSNILFLDPVPGIMRDYSRISDYELRPKADNLSSVLYKLCSNKEYKKKLLEILQSFPENDIKDIDFIKTSIGDVMLQLKEKYGDKTEYVEAKRLSDGTLRYLAIITSLISGEPNSMVVIEEVDNGIHPSRIRNLVQTITHFANEKRIDVIITTHNPALLNVLSKEEMLGVVLCYRTIEDGTSQFFALPDLDALPALLAKGKLGDLTVRGELLNAIKNPEPPHRDLSWLEV